MEVAVTELRAHLSEWLDRARAGEELIVTERGIPVARVTGIDTVGVIERLVRQGVISPPVSGTRTKASGRHRPRPSASVADLTSELRD